MTGGRGLEVVANVHLLKQVSIPQAGFQTLKPSPIWPYLPRFPNLLLLPQIHKWNSLNELGSFIPKWFQPPPGFICKLLSYILSYILPIKTQTFERCGKLTLSRLQLNKGRSQDATEASPAGYVPTTYQGPVTASGTSSQIPYTFVRHPAAASLFYHSHVIALKNYHHKMHILTQGWKGSERDPSCVLLWKRSLLLIISNTTQSFAFHFVL